MVALFDLADYWDKILINKTTERLTKFLKIDKMLCSERKTGYLVKKNYYELKKARLIISLEILSLVSSFSAVRYFYGLIVGEG